MMDKTQNLFKNRIAVVCSIISITCSLSLNAESKYQHPLLRNQTNVHWIDIPAEDEQESSVEPNTSIEVDKQAMESPSAPAPTQIPTSSALPSTSVPSNAVSRGSSSDPQIENIENRTAAQAPSPVQSTSSNNDSYDYNSSAIIPFNDSPAAQNEDISTTASCLQPDSQKICIPYSPDRPLYLSLEFNQNPESKCCNVIPSRPNYCPKYADFYIGLLGFNRCIDFDSRSIGLENIYGNCRNGHINNWLWGINTGITYRKPCGWYANLDFEWATGDLDGRRNIARRDIDHYLVEARGGYNFLFACRLLFTPYVGYGWWFSHQHLHRTGIKLRYQSNFVSLGIKADYAIYSFLTFGIDAKWYGQLDSTLRYNQIHAVRFCLNKRNGYSFEFPLNYYLCNNSYTLSIAPFVRGLLDGKSHRYHDGENIIRFPRQNNYDTGFKLLAHFNF